MTHFDKFISPARERSEIWRTIVTLVIWLTVYLLMTGIIFGVLKVSGDAEISHAIATNRFDTPRTTLLLLASFIPWIIALLLPLWFLHKRGLPSLLGMPWARLIRHLVLGVLIYTAIAAVLLVATWPSDKITQQFELAQWQRYLAIGVLLIFVQVAAEELLFRGFLQQQLAARFKSKWIYIFLPSVLFGLGHYTAENGVVVGILFVAVTALRGIILSEITYRTGNLGWAIAIHFVNNLQALVLISYQEELSGLALYVVPDAFDTPDKAVALLAPHFILMVVFYAVYYYVMERRAARIET